MSQEQDKDLDILLKQYAKRESLRAKLSGVVDEENSEKSFGFTASEHLDADEMNAYAENALPQTARLRYASHLVDCDACRKLVTQLTLSANPIFVEEKSAVAVAGTAVTTSSQTETSVAQKAETKTWQEKIASFFTLPNLRIAGPIVAVVCISAISFVVWQRSKNEIYSSNAAQPRQEDVAIDYKKKDDGPASPTVSTSETPTNGNSTQSGGDLKPNENTSTKDTGKEKPKEEEPKQPEKTGESSGKSEAPKGQPQPTTTGEVAKEAPKDMKREGDNAPAPAPKTASTPTLSKKGGGPYNNRNERSNRDMNENAEQKQAETPSTGGSADSTNKTESQEDRKQKTQSTPRKKTDSDDEKGQDKPVAQSASSETRTVSGKRFRRVGNSWVDVDYQSSFATTILKRGSEQYRATIADEPVIRNFAEQLGGEVIVVWKGRAYKIQ